MQQSVNPALVVAALLLAYTSGTASNATIKESVDAPSDPAIGLSITRNNSRLIIQGYVSSTAHEALLRQTAARYFPGIELEIDVQRHAPMPPGWSLVTDTTLHAMADTHSSSAFIDEHHIGIGGIVTDTAAWSLSADRINISLLNGMRLYLNVVPVEKSAQFSRLCENLFARALHNRNVDFRESSARLRTNALSLLDEIAEIATDCPTASITVTGHTDSTGNESTNRALSEARAMSVVTYLIERGIEPHRLTTNGVGSAGAIASNEDAAGRQVNRRIEFELTFP